MSSPDAALVALVLEVRAPLARIELAASRLLREDPSPRGQRLATTIREAVAQMDRRLALASRVLVPPDPGPREPADRVLEGLVARMRPVFAARGLALELAPVPRLPVSASPLRRASLALLQHAAWEMEQRNAGGAVGLRLRVEGARHGVEARWPVGEPPGPEDPELSVALGEAAAATGTRAEMGHGEATLWLEGAA